MPAPERLPSAPDGRTAQAIAEEAVRAAGAVIRHRLPEMTGPRELRKVLVSTKNDNDLVTDVDHAAEQAAIRVLTTHFPTASVVAEESGRTPGEGMLTWFLDPLDGTRNFASGIPMLAVNLALADSDGILLGVTYDPVRDELFHATAGGGAWLNGQRLAVSAETELANCMLGFDVGPANQRGRLLLEMLSALWPSLRGMRLMGSTALGLAYAAAGRFDLYVSNQAWEWDLAPGLLLVREAGGIVTGPSGEPARPDSGRVVAGSRSVHEAFARTTDGAPWRG